MSFSVQDAQFEIEWSGKNLLTIFSQIKNLFSIKFVYMLIEIIKFNLLSKKILKNKKIDFSVRDFLAHYKFSKYFINLYLLPMAGAIWS